ncbi:hypothetical protein [Haloglomus halophilum]|uniref:hypothetical protein n=1 Tax=Haloglomus halophilum TaxID=2962672 RepID=UPI0020C96A8A|nr:hypothetical protein [Haloglomus halophilum]
MSPHPALPDPLDWLLDRMVWVGWSRAERRLRLPIRVALTLVLFVLCSRAAGVGIRLLTDDYRGGALAGALPGSDLGTVLRVASALFALAAVALAIAIAGVFLAPGYVLSGELAIPLGLHLSWNYAQGVLFEFPVSGVGLGVAVVRTRETGPDLVTGGRFGPEVGLLGVVAILVGIAAIAWWVRARTGRLGLEPGVWTPDLRWRAE